jgi:hypothetical protein
VSESETRYKTVNLTVVEIERIQNILEFEIETLRGAVDDKRMRPTIRAITDAERQRLESIQLRFSTAKWADDAKSPIDNFS